MSRNSAPDDKTTMRHLPGWSQAETIAIRVQRWRKHSRLWWLLPAGLGLFGSMLVIGAITYGMLTADSANADRRKPDPALITTVNGTPLAVTAAAPTALGPTQAAEKPLTIVLLGSDRRPNEGTIGRTDSIHVIAVDADGKGVGVLGLPRDLYVNIPDRGRDRINLVFAAGKDDLLRRTLADNFGIQMDHYVFIDFSVFVALVNTIGGIDVNVPYTIDDPLYPDQEYGYDPFFLEAGAQHLDGETALKYARTRHQTNDFDRARRQQQIMLAVRDRILRFDLLPVLAPQIPTLYTTLAGGYKTDLTPDQIVELVLELKDVDEASIRTGVVDDKATLDFVTPEGASVLVPDTAKVTELINSILYPK